MYIIYGQTPVCTPNILYKDSAAGIYPRPYNDSTKLGGIPKTACIDQPYEFPLTVSIPDTVTVPFGGSNLTLGLINASLDTSKAVVGLPKGIKYYCNPGNCVFEKNKIGCIVLRGTATSENKPGNYDLLINLKLVTTLGSFDVTFPGPIFPGKYFITVAEKNSGACATSDLRTLIPFQGEISTFPNPVRNQLSVKVNAVNPGLSELMISNVMGVLMFKKSLNLIQGLNQFSIPVEQLANGVYYYTISQRNMTATRKIIVLKD